MRFNCKSGELPARPEVYVPVGTGGPGLAVLFNLRVHKGMVEFKPHLSGKCHYLTTPPRAPGSSGGGTGRIKLLDSAQRGLLSARPVSSSLASCSAQQDHVLCALINIGPPSHLQVIAQMRLSRYLLMLPFCIHTCYAPARSITSTFTRAVSAQGHRHLPFPSLSICRV